MIGRAGIVRFAASGRRLVSGTVLAVMVSLIGAVPALAIQSDQTTTTVSPNAQGDPAGASMIWLVAFVAAVAVVVVGFLKTRRTR